MALVTHLEKVENHNKRNIHEEVGEAIFYIIETPSGKILQIDTFGRPQREFPSKVSQSIQFSPSALKQLKKIVETL